MCHHRSPSLPAVTNRDDDGSGSQLPPTPTSHNLGAFFAAMDAASPRAKESKQPHAQPRADSSRAHKAGQASRGVITSRSHLARPRATKRPTHAPSPTTSNDTTHAPSQTTSNDTHARTIAKGAPDVVRKRIARQIQGARPRYWMRGHVETKERQRRRKRSHRVVLTSKDRETTQGLNSYLRPGTTSAPISSPPPGRTRSSRRFSDVRREIE